MTYAQFCDRIGIDNKAKNHITPPPKFPKSSYDPSGPVVPDTLLKPDDVFVFRVCVLVGGLLPFLCFKLLKSQRKPERFNF